MKRLGSICFLSFWVLAVKAPLGGLGAVGLKPGIYRNLKLTEPVVLKKGSYTFVGLEMHGASLMFGGKEPIVWVDAARADTVRFIDCLFTEIDNGTVLLLKGVAKVGNCVFEGKAWPGFLQQASVGNKKRVGVHFTTRNGSLTLVCNQFSKLHTATQLAGSKGKRVEHYIRQNTFSDNETALRFESSYQANHKIRLNCNKFEYSAASPFSKRYGIYVENGANMPSNIGGSGPNTDFPDYPSGNWWPRVTLGLDINNWTCPSNWIPVHNESGNNWKYYGYANEFIGKPIDFEEISGGGVFELDQTTDYVVSNLTSVTSPTPGGPYEDATLHKDCFNFGNITVFPTRQAVEKQELSQLTSDSEVKAKLFDPIPNPASQSTQIGFVLSGNSKTSFVEIFDIGSGRLLKRFEITGTAGKLEIDLSGFMSGIYGCRLVSDGNFVDLKRLSVIH